MSEKQVGWKFGADIEGPDGHLTPRTCYVAITEAEAALKALTTEYPGAALHPGPGQAVSSEEWSKTFDAKPTDGEVRCDG